LRESDSKRIDEEYYQSNGARVKCIDENAGHITIGGDLALG